MAGEYGSVREGAACGGDDVERFGGGEGGGAGF